MGLDFDFGDLQVAGAKRNSEGIGDGDDGCRKRVKVRDLGSVFQSEGMYWCLKDLDFCFVNL